MSEWSHKGPVVVSGEPDWLPLVQEVVAKHGFAVMVYSPVIAGGALVARLADDHAAFLVVDGALEDWSDRVAVVRTSPATRRVPLVVVTDHLVQMGVARDAGADHALRPDELEEMLPRLLAAEARIHDAAHMAELACQCGEALPEDGQEAVRLFNAGEYYRQHDLFEALWMAEPGPVRNLYRAILQIGVGYYHIQRGNMRGALKMLLRSLQWLAPLPPVCQGVDVARLKADSASVRMALEALLDSEEAVFDPALLKPVRLVEEQDDR